MNSFSILNIRFSDINPEKLIFELKNKKGGYVCFLNTRTLYIASKQKKYLEILQNSKFSFLDGQPLTWVMYFKGFKKVSRISGPETLYKIFKTKNNLDHFLLGDKPNVLNEIVYEYGNKNNIVGYYSPPFTNIENVNIEKISHIIMKTKPDVVWVGLGSPKQDFVSSSLSKKFPQITFINVGAAFRFLLGEYKMPNKSIEKIGLTGVFWRFKQRPLLFIKKYPVYIYFIIKLIINERKKSRI